MRINKNAFRAGALRLLAIGRACSPPNACCCAFGAAAMPIGAERGTDGPLRLVDRDAIRATLAISRARKRLQQKVEINGAGTKGSGCAEHACVC